MSLLLLGAGLGAAQAQDADPEHTREALAWLLAASRVAIPGTSSCHGAYGERGVATVGGLLSMQLAYLYRGDNVLSGQCQGGPERHCVLNITHAFGEDRSSARIEFAVRSGRLSAGSLRCVITP
ncbi:hypothetical protein [Azohydromonas caseinilytica]|uniref:Uncharacterized protein n=1 Tax=Azohydromonas caseinilytica TaxID=2728836 RepID=A0A848FC77_9BURK|nr:hypothetical protein [Azohydromonas caseinilytica]NML16546.1 hypothetical protein [Azohydromonas caseinilytica]